MKMVAQLMEAGVILVYGLRAAPRAWGTQRHNYGSVHATVQHHRMVENHVKVTTLKPERVLELYHVQIRRLWTQMADNS